MMKILKKAIYILLAFFILAAALLWSLTKIISPELMRDYVKAQLILITGQSNDINGNISWNLFPHPSLSLKNIHFGQNETYTVDINDLLFNLKLGALLRGKLIFDKISVNGFNININQTSASTIEQLQKNLTSEENSKLQNSLAIKNLLLTKGKITWLTQQRKTVISNLQIGINQFNLDRIYFPLQFKANIQVEEENKQLARSYFSFKGNARLSPAFLIHPVKHLNDLNIDGQLLGKDLHLQKLSIARLNGHAFIKKGLFSLNPLTLNLFKGESIGDLLYYFDSKKLFINQSASNINSHLLTKNWFDKPILNGLIDFSLHLQSNLNDSNWLASFLGDGNFTIKDGSLAVINLQKVIDKISFIVDESVINNKNNMKQLLELGQFANSEFFTGNTPFQLLTVQYRIHKNKLDSNSILLYTDSLQLKGQGQLDFSDYSLNGTVLAMINNANKIGDIQQLLGGSFPLIIRGTLIKPIIIPDLKIINPVLTNLWIKTAFQKPIKLLQHVKSIIK